MKAMRSGSVLSSTLSLSPHPSHNHGFVVVGSAKIDATWATVNGFSIGMVLNLSAFYDTFDGGYKPGFYTTDSF